jgi:hypothetical protein
MIFNLMDLTPDVNALVYGWRPTPTSFDSLTLLSGPPLSRWNQPEIHAGRSAGQ